MDRFDDIWKNRFNDGDVPIGDWNTPDDDLVWEGIAPHIPQQSDRKRLVWLWWTIGVLLLMVLGLVAMQKSMAKNNVNVKASEVTSQSEVNNLTETAEFTTKNTKDNTNLSNDNYSTNIEKNLNDAEHLTAKAGSMNDSVTENKVIATQKKSASNTSKSPRIVKRNFQLPPLKTDFEENKISIKEVKTKEQAEFAELNMLPLLDLKNLAQKNTLNNTLNVLPPDSEEDRKGKIALSINAGAVYWQHQISDQYTNDLSPFDFNYGNDWGWQTSLLASINANDYLTPFIGVQYESVQVTSGHNSDLNYDTNNEQGANANTYTQNLATPYGLSEATFRLNRDVDFTDEMADLTVDFKSTHQIQNWSMPLGLQVYPFGKKQRFQWNASVGMGINYLASIENQLKNVDTHHDFIQYSVDSPAIFNSPTIEKWHYDVRLGTGLNYFINNNLQFNFQYNWVRGLNPVFQQGDYATRINRHQLSVGVVKTLSFK